MDAVGSPSRGPSAERRPGVDLVALGSLRVTRLALGGNVFGWQIDERTSWRILDAFVDAGGNWIDTADFYAAFAPGHHGGESEAVLGGWLARPGNRDRVMIATKVGWKPGLTGLAPATIERAIEESLQRLRTDHVDLYYAHADDPETPLADTLGAFGRVLEQGKAREIGASNYSAPRLIEALELASSADLPRFVALQTLYSAVERDEYERELAPALAAHGLPGVSHTSLAKGFLSGRFSTATLAADDASPWAQATRRLEPRGAGVLDAIREVASARGVRPPAVALAWLLSRPALAAAAAAVTSVEQLDELLPGITLSLTESELSAITAAGDVSAAAESRGQAGS